MRASAFHTLFILASLLTGPVVAQDNFVLSTVSKSNVGAVKVKWYSKAFVYPEGVNLYRRESGESSWTKVNTAVIKKGDYTPTAAELQQDKELKDYLSMVSSIVKLEGVPLLGAYVKSFKSEAFSRYLGIECIDNGAGSGKMMQYKVCVLKQGLETELGISTPILSGKSTEILPPQQIAILAKNKQTSIKWLPETSRYYGVDIYRMMDSSGSDRVKVNKDPVIISKTKNKEGKYDYPEQFYVDDKLREDTTYYYSFKVLDFFGDESEFMTPIRVFVKDLNAPLPPVPHGYTTTKKSVRISWHKAEFEKDFVGFQVYRAYRSEPQFVQASKHLLSRKDTVFEDTLSRYGPYRYVIASVDRSDNEGVTEALALELIDEEPPAVPKGLVIKSDTGKVLLSWEANAEADLWGYMVYQTVNKNARNDAYVLITPTPIRSNRFEQSLAKNSKNKFLYKVLAVDSTYNKSALSEFAATTLPDVTAPSEPFISNCYIDEKKNNVVEFFKNPELDLRGYDLYRIYTEDEQEKTEKVNVKPIDRSAYRFTDHDFQGYGLVKYYLTASDSSGNTSRPSNTVKLNIKKPEEVITYAFKNFNTKALRPANNWQLKWKMSTDEPVFFVVYTRGEGDANFEPQTKNLDQNKCTLRTKGKAYVQVRAYTSKGLVAKSDIKLLESHSKN